MSETSTAVAVNERPLDEFHEKLDAFRALRKNDQAAADQLLAALGGHGPVEEQILLELSAWDPLYRPGEFESAHNNAMRALEVLYRNGHRNGSAPKAGPLTFFAKYFVRMFTQLVVRNHVHSVVESLHNLYTRRWTSAPQRTPEAAMLRRASYHLEKAMPGYKGRSLALPTFLVGGAFVSSFSSLLTQLVDSGRENTAVLVGLLVLLYLVLSGLGWCLLRGAAVARTRIRLSLDEPLAILYDAIGAAGKPPKDQAMSFALYSFIVLGLSAVVIPIVVVVAFVV